MTNRPLQPRFGDVVRVNTPSHPLTDLYYHMLRAPWVTLIGLVAAVYLVVNIGFAAVYVLAGADISNARPNSFADAFFFSVQSMSTIGYGAMSPDSPTAHVIVTAEAIVGLLCVALVTGLVFAKFSRPRAKVLFSDKAVVTTRNGRRTLMFRVANARGNDIVEASMRVSVLKSEVSPEGHRMRRLHDLKLMRTRSPLFILTWLAIHELDADSPLFGETAQSIAEENMMLIVTLTGIDGTFAHTVYARHVYHPEDLRWNRRFADAISTREDGRVMIDYARFHDIEPERPAPAAPSADSRE